MYEGGQLGSMSRWSDRARKRLRHGETIEESVAVGDNGVVVTNQRVLSFTPAGDRANFRAVERPNVESISQRTIGDAEWLEYVGKAGLVGLVCVPLGLLVDFGSLLSIGDVSTDGAGQIGVGGMVGMLKSMSSLLGMLDDALLVAGLLGLTFALGALGMYVQSRTPTLLIEVAGDAEDVHVVSSEDRDDAVSRLRRVFRTEDLDAAAPAEDPLDPTVE
jgi:hypothetical protein